jgi:hypothetical protein
MVFDELEHLFGVHVARAGKDEAAYSGLDETGAFNRSSANLLVAGDENEATLTDDRKPHVVFAADRNFGEKRMAGVNDIVSLPGEEAAENEGVLVNEETNRGFVGHAAVAASCVSYAIAALMSSSGSS